MFRLVSLTNSEEVVQKVVAIDNARKAPRLADLPDQGWAMVRTSSKGKWSNLRLPLTVGYHQDNEVFVNAPTMRPISKVVFSNFGVLTAVNTADNSFAKIADLKPFGVEIVGPFSRDPAALTAVARITQRVFLGEAAAYGHRYPEALRRMLPRRQTTRLATLALAAVLGILALNADFSLDEVNTDRSKTPIRVATGNIVELKIASDGPSSPYANGVTLQFSAEPAASARPVVLTLGLSGLDMANEITLEISGKQIGAASAQLNCIDAPCTRDFSIDSKLLAASGSVIVIHHNPPASGYRLNHVFLRAMEPATPEDRETVSQLLTSAERFFEERHLLVQNIRNASEAAAEADRILATRTGLEALAPRASVLGTKIADSFKEISAELLFRLQKELRLGHAKAAVGLCNDLLKLYPDPASRQYGMLVAQRKKLQEAMK